MIKQAIIPLAGLGTRLLPLTVFLLKNCYLLMANLELNIFQMNVLMQELKKLYLLYPQKDNDKKIFLQ